MRLNFILTICLTFFAIQADLYAYPNFISLSYQSCLNCHYNPFGNGQLTDYGRAVGASELTSPVLTKKFLTKDEMGEMSTFLYGKMKSPKLKPSLSYRGLYLKTGIGEDTSQARWINMMADVGLMFKPFDETNLILVGSFGYAPTPNNNPNSEEANYRSREHYIGYRPNNNHGIYIGMMDKVFGIRVPDHNSYSKLITSLTMNDGSHGVLYHYTNESLDLGLQYFIGNMAQEDDLRQKGFTSTFEYSLSPKVRAGASFLAQSNQYIEQSMYAIHSRIAVDKGSSLMAEWGRVSKTNSSDDQTVSEYLFLQNHIMFQDGFFGILTFERFQANIEENSKVIKIGPALQFFPFVGVETRIDFYNSKVQSETSYSDDSWVFAGQVHLWL